MTERLKGTGPAPHVTAGWRQNGAPPRQAAWIVLAYLGPLAVVPFLFERRDTEVQWHAASGLVLCAAELVLFVVSIAVLGVASHVALTLGCAFSLLFVAGVLVALAVHAWAMLKGLGGTRLFLPGVSDLAERLRTWRQAQR